MMKMKKMKNNLDERQELELLRIEHTRLLARFLGIADRHADPAAHRK